MKYYVISRFFDDGGIEARLLLESEYQGQQNEDTAEYSQYVDVFSSFAQAEAYLEECKRA